MNNDTQTAAQTSRPLSVDTHITIIGGGIAGLATAHYLQQAGHTNYTVIESAPDWGGKIVTREKSGFVIEGGPDSFITQKPEALSLCRELGIEDKLMGTNDAGRKVYVLIKGQLRAMPDGVMLVIPTRFAPFVLSPLISLPGKIRMGLDLFIPRRSQNGDESLADFIRRRLGNEALDKIAEPLMAGIYVADPERLSLQSSFPRFINLEKKYRSLIRGMLIQKAQARNRPSPKMSIFMSLQRGLGYMVDTLVAQLQGDLMPSNQVIGLHPPAARDEGTPGRYRVQLQNGETLETDMVVLAVPAFAAARLTNDFHPELAARLNSIRYVSTATVSLGFRRAEFEHALNGFGFVIPSQEPTRLMACTWTSTKFPQRAPQDHVLVRAFVGGPHQEHLVNLDDAELVQLVREELRQIMGIQAQPVLTQVFRWPNANPQFDVGHLERIDEIETLSASFPGLYLTGSAYRGVGIPDCIRQGKATAEKIISQRRIQ